MPTFSVIQLTASKLLHFYRVLLLTKQGYDLHSAHGQEGIKCSVSVVTKLQKRCGKYYISREYD